MSLPSSESMESMTSTADEATQALSAAKEYDDYALVINAMPMAAALRACEQEGIMPSDTSLLGLRAALLLHFCGPPPTATTDEGGRQARVARAQQMRRGKRSRRGDRENRSRVPIWALQEFNAMAGEPALEADDFTGLIQNMAWQEAHVACRRLGINVDGLSGDGVRKALYESFVVGSEDDTPGSSVRLRAEDYRSMVMHLTPEQAANACRERGIVPVDWEPASVQAALRGYLLGPLSNTERTSKRRSFRGIAKSIVEVATAKGGTPFQKWRNYRTAQEDAADLERAKRIFEAIDLDRSGELDRGEIRELGAQLGAEMTEAELQSAMDEMDEDGNGEVDLDEFLAWWKNARSSDSTWARMIARRERQEKEREWLNDLFDHIDADGGGTLDIEEINMMTNDLGLSLTTVELSAAMEEMDKDNNGDVDFEEFFTWYVESSSAGQGLATEIQRGLQRSEMLQMARNAMFAAMDGGKGTDHLKILFDRLDEDGSRSIEVSELVYLVDGLRLNMTREEIEIAIQEMDKKNTGEIDFEEFSQWWQSRSGGVSGRLRSKLKLSGFLAKQRGTLLVATELLDGDEGLAASERYMEDLLASSFSQNHHPMVGKSLGVFGKDSPIRKTADAILSHPWTDRCLVLLIVINMATMSQPQSSRKFHEVTAGAAANGLELVLINIFIGLVFVAEMVLRVIQQGFWKGVQSEDGTVQNQSFIVSWWNRYDLLVVCGWVAVVAASMTLDVDPVVSNGVSVLRSLRMLRFVAHIRQTLTSVRKSLPALANVAMMFLLLFTAYHVILHSLFGGALTYTCAASIDNCTDCSGPAAAAAACPAPLGCELSELQCFQLRPPEMGSRAGHTDKYGFDNLQTSFVTLFSATTMDNWHEYVDTYRAVSEYPWWYSWASFASFVILSGLCLMNVFLAAIAHSYVETRRELRRFEDKKAANDAITMTLLSDPMAEAKAAKEAEDYGDPMCDCCGSAALTYKCRALIQHPAFGLFYLGVIIFNILCMASERHNMPEGLRASLLTAEYVCNFLYIFEAAVKIQGMGFHVYIKSKVNQVDFVIVVSGAMEMLSKFLDFALSGTGVVQALRPLRMFRLFRVARIARVALRSERVRNLLAKAFSSLPAVFSLCFLLVYILLVAGLAGQQVFGGCPLPGSREGFPARPNFNSMGDAVVASFAVLASDSWTELMFNFHECSSVAWWYFMVIVLSMHFVLADLFIAVFIENFQLENDEKRNLQIKKYLEEANAEGNGGVLHIKGRLDTVNDFLSAKTTQNTGVGFDAFVGGAVSTTTSAVVATGRALRIQRSANCLQRAVQRCAGGRETESAKNYHNPLRDSTKPNKIAVSNPLLSFDAEDGTESDAATPRSDDTAPAMRNLSLGLFDERHFVRLFCQNLLEHHRLSAAFHYYIVMMVICNATAVVLCHSTVSSGQNPNECYEQTDLATNIANMLHGAAMTGFVIEFIVKVIADGLLLTPQAYLSYPGQVIELGLLVLQFVSIFEPTARLFLILITFRLLYLLERPAVIMGTIEAVIPVVAPFFGLVAATVLMFGLLGMTIFMGKLYRCVDVDGQTIAGFGRSECETAAADGAEWVNRPNNFDDIFETAEVLFITWSLRGWVDMMFWAMDSAVEVDGPPAKDQRFLPAVLFYMTYIMWAAFMVTKLFIAMLVDFFSANSGKLLMTEGQRDWQFVNLVMYHLKPTHPLPNAEWRLKAYHLVESVGFTNFIDAAITCNVLQLIASNSFTILPSDFATISLVSEWLVILIYLGEMCAKVAAYGVLDYWVSCRLELGVLLSMLLASVASQVDGGAEWLHLQAFQAVRVLRVVQVLSRFAGVRKLYYVVKVTVPELLNLCFCVLILLFVSSVVAEELCGAVPRGTELTDLNNFDDLISSTRLLFQITTGQSFREITLECQSSSEHNNWIRLFFFCYYSLSNLIFLSLFVALLLDNLALMGSDNFSITDVDVELFRETWLEAGVAVDENIEIGEVRALVARMRGTFSFIHKSDPFWFNRLMMELGLNPGDEALNDTTISFSRLLRALCHMRFSSRCLSLEDEMAKQSQFRAHMQGHAAAIIHVCVLAWKARHNPPPEIKTQDEIRRWKLAVWCAQTLQMNAVIATQRITPENVVAESLNDLQRLVDRSQDSRSLATLRENNARQRAQQHQQKMQSGEGAKSVSLRDLKKAQRPLDKLSGDDTQPSPKNGLRKSPKQRMTESAVGEALDFGNKNAFLTRRTWHKNTGRDDTPELVPGGEHYSSGVKVADNRTEAVTGADSGTSPDSGTDLD